MTSRFINASLRRTAIAALALATMLLSGACVCKKVRPQSEVAPPDQSDLRLSTADLQIVMGVANNHRPGRSQELARYLATMNMPVSRLQKILSEVGLILADLRVEKSLAGLNSRPSSDPSARSKLEASKAVIDREISSRFDATAYQSNRALVKTYLPRIEWVFYVLQADFGEGT